MASGANNGVLGLGVHSMWGSSPAADLPAYASSTRSGGAAPAEGEESAAPLRVLVANPSDIRHVLASISRRRRRSVPAVEFYVLERVPEVIARHLLLLQVACDWELPVRQRATVFLEVFGNSQLQDRTQRYVHRLGQELVELVCNQAGALEDFVDLSALKYRERDRLVDVFRSWSPEVPFDVVGMRDYRLRSFYAERYDHRQGACDWDYHQRVKPAAGVVHSKLYKEWRMSGTAFEFGDQVYDRPNRTLGSYAEGTLKKGKDHGIKKEIRGYFVDIVNGPYVSFGVDTDRATEHAEGLFEVQNKGTGTEQHRHHTVEIAMFNLLSYLWEIETGEPYVMKKAHDIYSGLGEDASDVAYQRGVVAKGENTAATAAAAEESRRSQALQRARCIVDTFDNVKVSFLQTGVDELAGKAAFRDFFDVVHLSGATAHHLKEEGFGNILADKARVVVETAKYLVPLTKEQDAAYVEKIAEYATERGLKACRNFPSDDHIAFERA